jgi:hypothetical protein
MSNDILNNVHIKFETARNNGSDIVFLTDEEMSVSGIGLGLHKGLLVQEQPASVTVPVE